MVEERTNSEMEDWTVMVEEKRLDGDGGRKETHYLDKVREIENEN